MSALKAAIEGDCATDTAPEVAWRRGWSGDASATKGKSRGKILSQRMASNGCCAMERRRRDHLGCRSFYRTAEHHLMQMSHDGREA